MMLADGTVCYLAGPMSGLPDLNRPTFAAAAAALRATGLTILSPAETPLATSSGASWTECLRHDLGLLTRAQAIILLPGWPTSRGAKLELQVALALEMPVYLYDEGELIRCQR